MVCKIRFKNIFQCLLLLIFVVISQGCASIVGDQQHDLKIQSDQPDTLVSVIDEKGEIIYEGKVPVLLSLDKSNGDYWGAKKYKVDFRKEGFQTLEVPVQAVANNWYAAGNLITAWIGYAADPLTGKMFVLSPQYVSVKMSAQEVGISEKKIIKNVFTDTQLDYQSDENLEFGLGYSYAGIGVNYSSRLFYDVDGVIGLGMFGFLGGLQYTLPFCEQRMSCVYANAKLGYAPRAAGHVIAVEDVRSIGLGIRVRVSQRVAINFDANWLEFYNLDDRYYTDSDKFDTRYSVGFGRRF